MQRSRYIFSAVIACSLIGSMSASAKPLSSSERVICSKLRNCIDILKRHNASEFDYSVLESEFERFGEQGRKALFDVLESEAGNLEIANMILASGPLNAVETARLNQNWSIERAAQFLPLLRGNSDARDKLLLTLGHPDPNVREMARLALIALPNEARSRPIGDALVEPLLTALLKDPISSAAPYIENASSRGHTGFFSKLLSSGDAKLVSASYASLRRENPEQAFQSLLAEMRRLSSSKQSRAVGDMLAGRHKLRDDGFYLKFAKDISADKSFPVPARAAGLHAVLLDGNLDDISILPDSIEPFEFLIRRQSSVVLDAYIPALKEADDLNALALVLRTAQTEMWINRDQIAASLKGTRLFDVAVRALIRSDDIQSVRAGLSFARPLHNADIQSQINHPVNLIADAAGRALKIKNNRTKSLRPCRLSLFDLASISSQMPFFDTAWFETQAGGRVSANREALTSAHPTANGWLAGYDLDDQASASSAGGLVFFDNKTGDFRHVGDFVAPLAILPDRALSIGQTTSRFWVVDSWAPKFSEVSLYQINISAQSETIQHVGILPAGFRDFSVAPNGDFLVTFDPIGDAEAQPPLRYSTRQRVSRACAQNLAPLPSRTLN